MYGLNRRICLLLLLPLALSAAAPLNGGPQDGQDQKTAERQESFENFIDTVRKMLEEGDFRDAADYVDRACAAMPVEARPKPEEIFAARQGIASIFVKVQDFHAAFNELQKLFDYQVENLDNEKTQARLPNTLVTMGAGARQLDKRDQLLDNYGRAIQALEPLTDYESLSDSLSRMTVIKGLHAQLLVEMDKRDQATESLSDELEKIQALYESNPDNEVAIALFARTLGSLMRATPDTEQQIELYEQHQSLVRDKLDEEPGNIGLTVQFLAATVFRLNNLIENDPESARDLIKEARMRIAKITQANTSAERTMEQFNKAIGEYERRVESAITIKALIGQTAPEIDAESWINGPAMTPEDLRGNVVLLDFWAIWSPPCIEAMPRLKKLQEDYGDQGLKIVGITRHYNYKLNEQTGRPQRSQDEVSAEEENQALGQFLKSLELNYPTAIMPKNSPMRTDFGVTGIPHVVIIDKTGTVRLVKSGATQENIAAMEEMIQKLLAE